MKLKLKMKTVPKPIQCTEITLKGSQCTLPAVEKGLCRLHLYLHRRKTAA